MGSEDDHVKANVVLTYVYAVFEGSPCNVPIHLRLRKRALDLVPLTSNRLSASLPLPTRTCSSVQRVQHADQRAQNRTCHGSLYRGPIYWHSTTSPCSLVACTMGKMYNGPKFFGLSGMALSQAIGFAAGSGFFLFGYDQGLMGSLLTLASFNETFPSINTQGQSGTSHTATLQGATIGLYESECSVTCLNSGLTDIFSRMSRRCPFLPLDRGHPRSS
jgi:hypothetical protein